MNTRNLLETGIMSKSMSSLSVPVEFGTICSVFGHCPILVGVTPELGTTCDEAIAKESILLATKDSFSLVPTSRFRLVFSSEKGAIRPDPQFLATSTGATFGLAVALKKDMSDVWHFTGFLADMLVKKSTVWLPMTKNPSSVTDYY